MPDEFPDRLQFSVFTLDGVGDVLLSGAIEVGDAERFNRFLREMSSKPQLIALHSPGGLVSEAQAIGQQVRDEELPAAVLAGAYCLSSCPYVLAGGVERKVSLRAVV